MKIYSWMILPLLTASLFLTGCGSDSDNNDEAPPAAPVVQSDAPPSANEQFAAITPSGLVLEDKFTIAGRGTVYTVVPPTKVFPCHNRLWRNKIRCF